MRSNSYEVTGVEGGFLLIGEYEEIINAASVDEEDKAETRTIHNLIENLLPGDAEIETGKIIEPRAELKSNRRFVPAPGASSSALQEIVHQQMPGLNT